jgi:hypothetical protein
MKRNAATIFAALSFVTSLTTLVVVGLGVHKVMQELDVAKRKVEWIRQKSNATLSRLRSVVDTLEF